jgi:hypothetical protein
MAFFDNWLIGLSFSSSISAPNFLSAISDLL